MAHVVNLLLVSTINVLAYSKDRGGDRGFHNEGEISSGGSGTLGVCGNVHGKDTPCMWRPEPGD